MALKELDLFLGETNKVEIAKERLRTFEPEEGYYLAFSGGKDSQVIYHLALEAGVKFDAHFNVTTVDPPELLKFIKEHYPGVALDRPEKTMWQLIPHKGMPPTRIARYCCYELKEKGGIGRRLITGIRWAESNNRSKRKMNETCYRRGDKRYVRPIIDWTEQDVWSYIRGRNLPYCKLYDEGFHRIGCVGCPMADRVAHFKRWPNFKRAYLKAFGKLVERRKRMGLTNKLGWDSAEGVFNWWMDERKHKGDPDQTVMFE